MSKKHDHAPNEEVKLLDHEYDGIRELDNHMPRWWVLGFYFSIIFSIGYGIYYGFAGGPSSIDEYKAEMQAAPQRGVNPATEAPSTALAILTDAESLQAGKTLFTMHACLRCHRPDLGGSVGPNLTDNHWLHGCKPEEVAHSITTGFPEKGMTPFGNNQKMSPEQLQQVVSYIFSKKGSNPPNPKPLDPARDKLCKS